MTLILTISAHTRCFTIANIVILHYKAVYIYIYIFLVIQALYCIERPRLQIYLWTFPLEGKSKRVRSNGFYLFPKFSFSCTHRKVFATCVMTGRMRSLPIMLQSLMYVGKTAGHNYGRQISGKLPRYHHSLLLNTVVYEKDLIVT